MACPWKHRRAAGLTVRLLILAALLPGCSGAHSRPVSGGQVRSSAGPVPSRVALASLRMVTPQAGWAVALDGNGYPLAVVRTVDGGRVWRDAGPPGLRGQRLSAAFNSASDAWLTWNPKSWGRPVTYRTANGGLTWSRMGRVPVAVLGASAPDMVTRRLGWVGADLGVA